MAQYERIPPQSEEAERSVLGAILMDPEVLFDVSEILTPEDFYSKANQEI
ncbi:MAG: replicative DNA helicase, partial [Firmicutes bacterium]|nr:replicative DNA helicase [Bacillota bacterium]